MLTGLNSDQPPSAYDSGEELFYYKQIHLHIEFIIHVSEYDLVRKLNRFHLK
jgi:hypothetical protein